MSIKINLVDQWFIALDLGLVPFHFTYWNAICGRIRYYSTAYGQKWIGNYKFYSECYCQHKFLFCWYHAFWIFSSASFLLIFLEGVSVLSSALIPFSFKTVLFTRQASDNKLERRFLAIISSKLQNSSNSSSISQ